MFETTDQLGLDLQLFILGPHFFQNVSGLLTTKNHHDSTNHWLSNSNVYILKTWICWKIREPLLPWICPYLCIFFQWKWAPYLAPYVDSSSQHQTPSPNDLGSLWTETLLWTLLHGESDTIFLTRKSQWDEGRGNNLWDIGKYYRAYI